MISGILAIFFVIVKLPCCCFRCIYYTEQCSGILTQDFKSCPFISYIEDEICSRCGAEIDDVIRLLSIDTNYFW